MQTGKDIELAGDRLSVKTICKLTGINEHTLRAWERRYQVVEPERLDNGRRVYSLDDLEKLKLINKLLKNGFLIGHIANYSQEDLSKLLQETGNKVDAVSGPRQLTDVFRALEIALERFEIQRVYSLLERIRQEYGIREYIFEVLCPLRVRIKNLSEENKLSPSHLIILSEVLKTQLLHALFKINGSERLDGFRTRSFCVATMNGCFQEVAVLAAAVICSINEFPVVYLGSNLDAQALSESIELSKSNTLILGLQDQPETESLKGYLEDLDSRLVNRCEIWLEGESELDLILDRGTAIKRVGSLKDLDHTLISFR